MVRISIVVIGVFLLMNVLRAQDHRFGGELWQGINFVSVSSPSSQVGYSRGVGFTYDLHKKGSAFSFGASLQAGGYRFRWANNEQIIVSTNQGYAGCLLNASYVFHDRYFLGPGILLQWLGMPDVHFKDYHTRVTMSRSNFNDSYGHVPFQPAVVLQGGMAIDRQTRFLLKLLLIQHVSDLMSHDYMVDFLTTPPSPLSVMPGDVKPLHIVFGFCYRPLKSVKKREEE